MSLLSFLKRQWRDIPKTIYFNFKVFDLKTALRLPVVVSHRITISKIHKGCMVVPENARRFSITLGTEGTDGVTNIRDGYILLEDSAKLFFKGKASISKGAMIRSSGEISFGDNFYCNCNISIICSQKITFGDNCILGWNVHIRDCDGHSLFQNGERINPNKDVQIGDHVWIGQDVKILKGSAIPENSVVAMNSCVTKSFTEPKTIIGGYPAKVIKQNIDWEV